jgi:hypothetical protein
MKTIYRNQNALASQLSAPLLDWKYYGWFDFILAGTTKGSGMPGGIDQGWPQPHVEVVDLEEVPISPKRVAYLQTRVDGNLKKHFKKTQKHKRDET